MLCKLCGRKRKLVKAHILPESFYEPDKGDLRLLFDQEKCYPKRHPIGIYDPQILCSECETKFGNWDAYAYDLLYRRWNERKRVKFADDLHADVYESFDYKKLKLFFMSVLLRADLSENDFWKSWRICEDLWSLINIEWSPFCRRSGKKIRRPERKIKTNLHLNFAK